MTHRDRAGGPPGRRGAAGDAGHPPSAAAAPLLRRTGRQGFPTPSGGSPTRPEAASQGIRAASPAARDAPHHHATRSLPKTLRSRLHESFLWIIGISLAKSKCFETWQKRAAGSGSTKLQIQTEALSDVYFGRGQTIRKDQTKDNRITAFATLQISRPK